MRTSSLMSRIMSWQARASSLLQRTSIIVHVQYCHTQFCPECMRRTSSLMQAPGGGGCRRNEDSHQLDSSSMIEARDGGYSCPMHASCYLACLPLPCAALRASCYLACLPLPCAALRASLCLPLPPSALHSDKEAVPNSSRANEEEVDCGIFSVVEDVDSDSRSVAKVLDCVSPSVVKEVDSLS